HLGRHLFALPLRNRLGFAPSITTLLFNLLCCHNAVNVSTYSTTIDPDINVDTTKTVSHINATQSQHLWVITGVFLKNIHTALIYSQHPKSSKDRVNYTECGLRQ